MVDVGFVEQLVDSMGEAVLKLERTIQKEDFEAAQRLKTFIFDLHEQINKALGGNHV